jgi:VIT1/CCC1 family predicted Fe2+/Mn2+ transporter
LARLLGTEAVLPLMLRTEAAEADRYRDDDEATAAMAAQEAAAGRTIAAMQGIPEGGRIARSEGRHRAGVGGVLRASVFGANDGLVSNFSLVMGVAGGTSNNSLVLLAGIAGIVAGAFSMASGEWISIRSQRELYENELRVEQEELIAFPEEEREELEMIYRAKGIAPEAARSLVDNIMNRNDVALDTLAREELGLDPTTLGSPWVAAVSSFVAFALGALLPVIPFLFGSGTAATIVAAAVSIVALFGVGAATSIFTGRHAGRAGIRMALIGTVVALVTFFVGKVVGQTV